jgi:hypothetical protein
LFASRSLIAQHTRAIGVFHVELTLATLYRTLLTLQFRWATSITSRNLRVSSIRNALLTADKISDTNRTCAHACHR